MKAFFKNTWKKALAAVLAAGLMSGVPALAAHAGEGDMKACYSGFFYGVGWSEEHEDNTQDAAPAGSYVTAIRASLRNQPKDMSGTIAYQVNLSGQGWLDWAENQMDGGKTDTAAPLEAVKMKLTGDLADHYDVYYSVLQSGTWTPWAKNEEKAGVDGQGLRVDGIKVSITAKGGEQPPDQPAPPSVDPSKPMVALTFDDGPYAKVTNRILDVLEANGARATFFMVGNRVPGNADAVRRMADLGCETGNHTYDHKYYLPKMSEEHIRSSVGQTNTNIANVTGTVPTLMRPTGGFYNDASLKTLGSMGMSAVMWSVDTQDWKTRNTDKTIHGALDHVKDGDIILMHDLYGTTADAVETIVPQLKAKGYQLVTVSEMAASRGGIEPGKVYSSFRPH